MQLQLWSLAHILIVFGFPNRMDFSVYTIIKLYIVWIHFKVKPYYPSIVFKQEMSIRLALVFNIGLR